MMAYALVLLLHGVAYAGECALDADGDGFAGSTLQPDGDGACTSAGELPAARVDEDCNDDDPAVNPAAAEQLGDLVDENCDAVIGCFADGDDDGFRSEDADPGWEPDLDCDGRGEALTAAPSGDCNDGDPKTYPGAPELLGDDFDQDCDGTEICYRDRDEDGRRTDETFVSDDADCDDPGEAHPGMIGGDCDDEDPAALQDCPPAGSDLTGSGCASAPGFLGIMAVIMAARASRRRAC